MPDDTIEESLDDYRTYDEQLTIQLAGFQRMRRQVRLLPLVGVVVGAAVAIASKLLLGAAVAGVGLVFWGATLYITEMRSWQYTGERRRIRDEIRELEEDVSRR